MKREHLIDDWQKTIDAARMACEAAGPRPCDGCIAAALDLMARAAASATGARYDGAGVPVIHNGRVIGAARLAEGAMPQNRPGHEWENLKDVLKVQGTEPSAVWVSKTAARAIICASGKALDSGVYVPGKDARTDMIVMQGVAAGFVADAIARQPDTAKGETRYLRILESAVDGLPSLFVGIADRSGDGIMDTYYIGAKREEIEPWISK